MYKRENLVAALLLAAAVSGCQVGSDYGTAEQAILNGETAFDDFQSTCVMEVALPPDEDGNDQDPLLCTCTLVSDQIVLTAARCVNENVDADELGGIDVRFGTGLMESDLYAVDEVEIQRYFNPEQQSGNGIALLRLSEAPGETPVTLNETPLTGEHVGTEMTLVGFGESEEGVSTTEGARRQTTAPIRSVEPKFVFAGTEEATTCDGDSGGPGFIDLGEGRVQATVTLRHARDSCFRNIQRVRVDAHLEDFIYPYIDRFNGPCQKDGVCEEASECRSPDPDCDPCLWGNECEEDCPTRDFDCPLGSFVGETCDKDGDCEEGGRCVAALDDEEFTYCTRPCDPAGAGGQCPTEMTCDDLGGGEGECVFETPSPGSQGYPCGSDLDCRSGICEDTICVTECQGQGDCEEPYTCGPSSVAEGTMVCLGEPTSGGGGFGFCSAGGAAGKEWPVLVAAALLAVALGGRRRRRRWGAQQF